MDYDKLPPHLIKELPEFLEMHKSESVAVKWNYYKNKVIGEGASDVQYNESEKAFYSGAIGVFEIILSASIKPELEQQELIKKLEFELRSFAFDRVANSHKKTKQ